MNTPFTSTTPKTGRLQYRCLARNHYTVGHYDVVPLRQKDMLPIKNWRNEQIRMLRQRKPLTDDVQIQYYQTVVQALFDAEQPDQLLFSYLLDGQCIGYGGLTHIDWEARRAEVSFLLDTKRHQDVAIFKAEFCLFFDVMKQVAFQDLQLNRLFTETYDIRPYEIEAVEAAGFQREGCLREHVVIDGQFVDAIFHGCLRREATPHA